MPLTMRRRPGRKTAVTPVRQPGEVAVDTRTDPALVEALARAFRYQRLLDEGLYASISEMAETERIERGYRGTLLRLTLLAPDIVEAILDGRHAEELTLPRLLEPLPLAWTEQVRPHNASVRAASPLSHAWRPASHPDTIDSGTNRGAPTACRSTRQGRMASSPSRSPPRGGRLEGAR
jgi:hypothetical protein